MSAAPAVSDPRLAAWVTVAGGQRHLCALGPGRAWSALCLAPVEAVEDGPRIPRRCRACSIMGLEPLGLLIVPAEMRLRLPGPAGAA